MTEVPCPFGGTCPENCPGRPTAEGLQGWLAQTPIPEVSPNLSFTKRRRAEEQRKKAIGTRTFKTNTAIGQTRDVCVNRQK